MPYRLLITTVVLALVAAACADDDTDTDGVAPPAPDVTTELRITVDGGEFDEVVYAVRCGDDQRSIDPPVDGLTADRACQRLDDPETRTRLVEGPPEDQLCTQEYGGPQVARISGVLGDDTVEAVVTRLDGCEIDDWDRLLDGVLPDTIGAAAEE
jgi:hypothetical protein